MLIVAFLLNFLMFDLKADIASEAWLLYLIKHPTDFEWSTFKGQCNNISHWAYLYPSAKLKHQTRHDTTVLNARSDIRFTEIQCNLKKKKKKKKDKIGVEMIFSILMLSSVHSNLLVNLELIPKVCFHRFHESLIFFAINFEWCSNKNLVSIFLFQVNNRNTRKRCEIRSKLTIKTTKTALLTSFLCFYC